MNAPTWGRDDVLYTGNDDGTSFGDIEKQCYAFGKLEGDDPYSLKGTTVNGMDEFREPLIFGPQRRAGKLLRPIRLKVFAIDL